jgi:hypothetical protein
MAASPFSDELRVFQEKRDEWVRSNLGKFVVIQDSTVAEGFFNSYSEALQAGLTKFGVSRGFLVKQVWMTEPVYFVSQYGTHRAAMGSFRP